MEFVELKKIAQQTIAPRTTGRNCEVGHVACALLTMDNHVYTGVSLGLPCGIGFCAEHSAVAAMITAKESQIRKIVAVYQDGSILAPCGRCRELLSQVDDNNLNCEILLTSGPVTLEKLLPTRWDENRY